MSTLTDQLSLVKAEPTDNVLVVPQIADNFQIIDDALGHIPVAALGYKNYIRNGDFSVAQRGIGAFTTNGAIGIDGWRTNFSGAGTPVSIVRGALVVDRVPGAKYAIGPTVAGQSGVSDFVNISQSIEGVETLSGKYVTLSFWARSNVGSPKIGIEIQQNFGTGGSPSPAVNLAVAAVTISTVMTRYSVSFTVPSISGKTLGQLADNLQVFFWLSAGANYAARASNIGVQNDAFQIADVQLEVGRKATPFEKLPQALQLQWCQRYFQRLTATNTSFLFGYGSSISSTGSQFIWNFRNQMRDIPQAIGWSGATTMVPYDLAGGGYASAIARVNASVDAIFFSLTSAGGLTAGRPCYIIPDMGAYIEVSTEL